MKARAKSYEFSITYFGRGHNNNEELDQEIGGFVKAEDPAEIIEYAKLYLVSIQESVVRYQNFKVWKNFGDKKLIIDKELSSDIVYTEKDLTEKGSEFNVVMV